MIGLLTDTAQRVLNRDGSLHQYRPCFADDESFIHWAFGDKAMSNGYPNTKIRRGLTPVEMTTERITTGDHKGNFGLVPADEYWEQLGRVAFDAFWYGDPHKSNWDDETEVPEMDKRGWVRAAKAVAERIRNESA